MFYGKDRSPVTKAYLQHDEGYKGTLRVSDLGFKGLGFRA